MLVVFLTPLVYLQRWFSNCHCSATLYLTSSSLSVSSNVLKRDLSISFPIIHTSSYSFTNQTIPLTIIQRIDSVTNDSPRQYQYIPFCFVWRPHYEHSCSSHFMRQKRIPSPTSQITNLVSSTDLSLPLTQSTSILH
ncbi:hypothetical protein F4810DRAFT_470168 [Camillea tinctor]|nr:hypothetical protein F4810DRAFT_470168 [Camillea tinctor]